MSVKEGVVFMHCFILQGTLIRVFDTSTRRKTIELRRGADPATLYW